jgi:hypothetical protein
LCEAPHIFEVAGGSRVGRGRVAAGSQAGRGRFACVVCGRGCARPYVVCVCVMGGLRVGRTTRFLARSADFLAWVSRRWVVGKILARSAAVFLAVGGLWVGRLWVVGSVLAHSSDFLGSWVGRRWVAAKILAQKHILGTRAGRGWVTGGSQAGRGRVAGGSRAGRGRVAGGSRVGRGRVGRGWVAGPGAPHDYPLLEMKEVGRGRVEGGTNNNNNKFLARSDPQRPFAAPSL